MTDDWRGRHVLVTGGASFIGSHLVEALVARGARVRVVDDLRSGRRAHLEPLLADGRVELRVADLCEPEVARAAVRDREVVFHLAADHGGRGYVDAHQAGPAGNLYLDGLLFREALRAGVAKVVYASSGCVYPNHLQADPGAVLYLTEDMVGPPYDADNMYGWAKLMAEMTLRALHRERGLAAASCRYFTVYGPRAREDHGLIAMLARVFLGHDPVEVWGDGSQLRNWTFVDDIVAGTIRAAERIDDGTAVNLGTTERTRVIDAARLLLELFGRDARIATRPGMPSGPLNRIAANDLARTRLGWTPKVGLRDGLRRTIDWYVANRSPDEVRTALEREERAAAERLVHARAATA
jgi:nucleoside-diphosphate-sugar epimerase